MNYKERKEREDSGQESWGFLWALRALRFKKIFKTLCGLCALCGESLSGIFASFALFVALLAVEDDAVKINVRVIVHEENITIEVETDVSGIVRMPQETQQLHTALQTIGGNVTVRNGAYHGDFHGKKYEHWQIAVNLPVLEQDVVGC